MSMLLTVAHTLCDSMGTVHSSKVERCQGPAAVGSGCLLLGRDRQPDEQRSPAVRGWFSIRGSSLWLRIFGIGLQNAASEAVFARRRRYLCTH